jgi:hypothetical protein
MAYIVKGNKTAADVVADNEQVIGYCDTLDEARRVAIAAQTFEGFIAAWAEPGLTVPSAAPAWTLPGKYEF